MNARKQRFFIARPRSIWQPRRVLVALPLGLAFTVVVLVFSFVHADEQRRLHDTFERQATVLADVLKKNFDLYHEQVHTLRRFYASTGAVDRRAFSTFTSPALERHAGIQALEWVPYVRDEERATYEEAARRDGIPGFQITERTAQGGLIRRAPSEAYYPVHYVEPVGGNQATVGFDLASDPWRWEALARARDTGEVVATSRITLVRGGGDPYGFFLIMPVYTAEAPATVAARRAQLQGFVLGVFCIADMVAAVLEGLDVEDLTLQVFDEVGSPGERLLAVYGAALLEESFRANPAAMAWGTAYEMGGRSWRLHFTPSATFFTRRQTWFSWAVLAGGLLFTGLLGAFLLLITGRTTRVEKIVQERTDALSQANETLVLEGKARRKAQRELDNIFTLSPDMLCIAGTDGFFKRVNPACEKTLGYPRDVLLSQPFIDYVHPEDQAATLAEIARLADGIPTIHFENRYRHQDGSYRWLAWRTRPVNGVLYAVVRDVTEEKRSQEIFRHQTLLLKRAEEMAKVGHWRIALPSSRLEWSDEVYRIHGYDPEDNDFDLTVENAIDAYHPEDRSRIALMVERAIERGEGFEFELRLVRADGAVRHVVSRGECSVGAEGAVHAVFGVFMDITERKQAEEALKEREERMRLLYEVTSQANHDLGDQLTEALQRTTQLLGMDIGILSRIVGDTYIVEACYAPDGGLEPEQRFILRETYCSITLEAEDVVAINHTQTSLHERHPCYAAFGLESYIGIPILLHGRLYGTINFSSARPKQPAFSEADRDLMYLLRQWVSAMLERKQVDEALNRYNQALRESEEQLSTLINSAPSTIMLLDDAFRLIDINEAACNTLGVLEKAAVIGAHLQELSPTLTEDHLAQYRQVIATGEATDLAGTLGKVGEEAAYFEVRAFKSGKGLGLVANDVTEREQARKLLAQQAEELARSNAELEQFAYVASHDLQEPLRKIQAFGNRLAATYSDALDVRGLDYLRRMQGAAERMQQLITDLLDLSRVTSQGRPFEPVDLNHVVQAVLSDLEIRIEKTDGEVETEVLPTVDADPMQMHQLFQNLIGNALKFHRQGVPPRVRVHSRRREGAREGDREAHPACEIRIEDNGVGFEQQYVDRIFKPFQRLHGRGEYAGTGIGLAVCQKIAERHGGTITAQSTPGQGSTFTVLLTGSGSVSEPTEQPCMRKQETVE